MEKKSTRIAYFVALGVFIVLLVILGISFKDTPLPTFVYEDETVTAATPFAATFWSLLPPIVAIVLALISKEVYSSLFLSLIHISQRAVLRPGIAVLGNDGVHNCLQLVAEEDGEDVYKRQLQSV